ncbi:MAG TPA: DUF3040 domain-containing protein [Acidimicrobiales bacterium]|nr:DUF3040 domain-containing protein [Acidimicrobiales bacterium]
MSEGDKVRLSVRERQQLAAIQAMVEAGDPDLAKTLTGHRGSVQAGLRRASQTACMWGKTCFERRWLGPLLFVLGFVLIFTTIAVLPWLSVVGALMAAAGLGLAVHSWQGRRDHGAPRRRVGQSVGE